MTIEILETEVRPAPGSATSWGAIAGGALVAIATTLILFALGSGLGFAVSSPWSSLADTAGRLGVLAGIWLVVVQWFASAIGGYLTGRLRTRWIGTHTHEVFFRDTAHGFLTWAVASVIIAGVAAWVGAASTDTAARTAASAAASANLSYDADTLYRTPTNDEGALAPARAEAERLLAVSAARGGLSTDDLNYLVASISGRAGVTPAEAQHRIDLVAMREQRQADEARAAADKARKAASALAILTALSMLVGAFIASVAAALGGQQRDQHP